MYVNCDYMDLCLGIIVGVGPTNEIQDISHQSLQPLQLQLPTHTQSVTKMKSIWASFDAEIKLIKESRPAVNVQQNVEIDTYRREQILDSTEDPLAWWHRQSVKHHSRTETSGNEVPVLPCDEHACREMFFKGRRASQPTQGKPE